MREIKFRIFARIGDDDSREAGYLETPDGLEFFYDAGYRPLSYFLRFPDVFVVEQFTGFGDINDLEVYEGDVVRWEDQNFEGEVFDSDVGIVEWQRWGGFVINASCNKFEDERYLADALTKYQVLGNTNKQDIPNLKTSV